MADPQAVETEKPEPVPMPVAEDGFDIYSAAFGDIPANW